MLPCFLFVLCIYSLRLATPQTIEFTTPSNEAAQQDLDEEFNIDEIENQLEECKTQLIKDELDLSSDTNFVRIQNQQFVKEGEYFPFLGFNFHDMMRVASNETVKHRVKAGFQKATELNLTVCRMFAFIDGNNWRPHVFDLIRGTEYWHEPIPLQIKPGVFNEDMFRALDYVISTAADYDIRFILVLTNYWPGYGGVAQYIRWAYDIESTAGHTVDEFYLNPVPQLLYMRFVCELVRRVNTITGIRYRDDPTIMAYDLINEARCENCQSGTSNDDILTGWVAETSSFIKSIDPNHLMSTGSEGFFGHSEPKYWAYNPGSWVLCTGIDSMQQHSLPSIDFVTFRVYTSHKTWDYEANEECSHACHLKWIQLYIKGHMEAAQELQKPLVIEEFGYEVTNDEDLLKRKQVMYVTMQTALYYAAQKEIGVGALFWQGRVSGQYDWEKYSIYMDSSPKIEVVLSGPIQANEEEKLFYREEGKQECFDKEGPVWIENFQENFYKVDIKPMIVPSSLQDLTEVELIKIFADSFVALQTPFNL
eukprot:TRINITY_DN5127_c0_g1_i8.p1 TRINITY_DN5127_c0_g1~~TRINITY_DN5127_c0_g1_i8.p1  ORF type:complete len:580 (+),score=45.56 TRINITY_DN5127_c0_g1_i8:136-1740(+)